MPFTKTRPNTYKSPSGKKFTKKQVKAYYATDGFTKKKNKPKIVVNNKFKGTLGGAEFKGKKPTGKVIINVKAHKGDKKELASTIKHELMHVKHPKMTEKEVYKRTAKTKISPQEQSNLLKKLRTQSINRKMGSIKKKLKIKGDTKPGELINKFKEMNPTKRTAILGLV